MSIADHSGEAGPGWRERVSRWLPILVLAPSLAASFLYVFVFTGWTLYISLSDSSLLPSYGWVGLENYADLWASRRWNVAYRNLFLFSAFYVVGSIVIGLLLAILIDQRIRGEAAWRTIFLYPLAVSFIVTGTVWGWLYNPTAGIEFLVRGLGWENFEFALTTSRDYAIYAIVITGICIVVRKCITYVNNVVALLAFVEVSREHIVLMLEMTALQLSVVRHLHHGIHVKTRQFEMTENISAFDFRYVPPFISYQPRQYGYIFHGQWIFDRNDVRKQTHEFNAVDFTFVFVEQIMIA